MSLNILVSIEGDDKSFVEFFVATQEAKLQFPELMLDFFSLQPAPHYLVKLSPEWIKFHTDMKDLNKSYDLIVQLIPDPDVSYHLSNISSNGVSGVVSSPQLHVQGIWAQTYIACLGATRFSPFTLKDLFKHILIGDESPRSLTKNRSINKNGKILIDFANSKTDIEHSKFLQDVYTAYPNRVEEYNSASTLSNTYLYLGQNAALATLINHLGGVSILFHTSDWDFKSLPSSTLNWNLPPATILSFSLFNQMIQMSEYKIGKSFRLTDEFLGGLFLPYSDELFVDNLTLFDHIYYVSYCYINSLVDIDISIPKVSSALALRNKGIISVLNKIIHLNKFGIKFIQDYAAEQSSEASKNLSSLESDLIQKLSEIDELTGRTLAVYPELDLIRLQIQFTKAKVPGNSFSEISHNMILTFHEINQVILCIENLLNIVVNQHLGDNLHLK